MSNQMSTTSCKQAIAIDILLRNFGDAVIDAMCGKK
jgi:hypothetical protein